MMTSSVNSLVLNSRKSHEDRLVLEKAKKKLIRKKNAFKKPVLRVMTAIKRVSRRENHFRQKVVSAKECRESDVLQLK